MGYVIDSFYTRHRWPDRNPEQSLPMQVTGLRPGEKLFEELLADEENAIPTHHPEIKAAKIREHDFDIVKLAVDENEGLNYFRSSSQYLLKASGIKLSGCFFLRRPYLPYIRFEQILRKTKLHFIPFIFQNIKHQEFLISEQKQKIDFFITGKAMLKENRQKPNSLYGINK